MVQERLQLSGGVPTETAAAIDGQLASVNHLVPNFVTWIHAGATRGCRPHPLRGVRTPEQSRENRYSLRQ
jgi:hypothetical protein